jgi:uncharacterized protein YegP (UPF0339 family)
VEVLAMRKLLCGFCALAMLVAVQGPSDQAAAQGKKKATGVIEIGEGKDGKFRFFVRDDEGKLLAMSSPSGFESVKDAQEAIGTLKEVISTAKVTTLKKDAKKDGAKKDTKDK